jgi:glucose/mannose transport system substrate-binding protein
MRTSFRSIRAARAGVCGAACAALALLALPACSDAPTQTSTVEIMHWWNKGGEAQAISALLERCRNENPSLKIVDSSVPGGSYEARLAIAGRISGGIPPDTFQANGGWDLMAWVLYDGQNARLSKMNPIDDLAQDWREHVPDKVLGSVSYTDPTVNETHVYAVPLNIHRLNTLFYNRAVFQEIGIVPERDLNDLAGFFAVAEKVKQYAQDTGKPITPIALGYGQKQTWTLALVFFENILVAANPLVNRPEGALYEQLFSHPLPHDALKPDITYALEDFRRLISLANEDAEDIVWDEAMDRVLKGEAAMTIMGDWAMGFANNPKKMTDIFGFIPMPGTGRTFVFTTDTFGLPKDANEDTKNVLRVFGSTDGQQIFNEKKGSISARLDVKISEDDDRWPTFQAFGDETITKIAATSILAQQTYVDAISKALGDFAFHWQEGNATAVQHTMDNYSDLLMGSCWPQCQP